MMMTWIPVGERLPDDDRDVLALCDGGESWDGTKYPPFCEISNYKPDRVGTMVSGEVRPFPWNSPSVTHWMELPKPPP
jgi:hypothetical protein